MCEICDTVTKPTEIIETPCGLCEKPVRITWVIGGGFLHGDYDIIDMTAFHSDCWDKIEGMYIQ